MADTRGRGGDRGRDDGERDVRGRHEPAKHKRERDEQAVRIASERELWLLDPEVRDSPVQVRELLDPEFVEFGASGRRWDRDTVLSVLGPDPGPGPGPDGAGAPIIASEMSGVVLAPGVVHLTFITETDGRRARRSSIWRLRDDGWRLYFHQGTPIDDA
ncbi:DUF4440 domain-containing protein [Streptomyces sp. NPDC048639]|uniref:nuclear transport factor 2 family protein n=1 Tax=Streptomyces sp. NPDC048639 TaxID=3365581 RepID=UPI003714BA4C